ncbi:MAG: CubicO group peptidase (beta-lactamase class C family) [Alteromonadaceae bacterium]|jgi:CubicO group peptidase (beta-lactamase class C family)
MRFSRLMVTAVVFWLMPFSLFSADAAAKESPAPVDLVQIKQTIEKAMKAFNVPGIAVAIVKDDKVIMSKGFGLIQMGKRDKVNADTLFGIASNTKAFTTAALAILADEGKLNWDDKVTDYLPSFALRDPYVTQQFTIRDMLSHRSGLGIGAGDLMIWPASDITTDEIIKRVRYLKPMTSFRSEYAYDNLMYVMAGEIVARVSKMSWHEFIQKRILTPLKMTQTRMRYSAIEANNHNVATAHAPVDGQIKPVGGDFLESFSSAGSIASSVNDMSQWLRVQLKGGLIDTTGDKDNRLFSGVKGIEMWTPNTLQDVPPFNEEMDRTHFRAYGLGWRLNDHQGYKMVSHTGGIMGMVSRVVMIPEKQLGVVILTNQQSGPAFYAIAHDIINRYLEVEHKDWVSIYQHKQKNKVDEGQRVVEQLMKDRDSQSRPSLALADYAKLYRDDWYGDIEITLVDDKSKGQKLQMRFSRTPVLIGELEHFQHNTFIVRWYDRSTNADAFVNFQLTPEGKVDIVTMQAVSPLTDFSFDFHDLLLKPQL